MSENFHDVPQEMYDRLVALFGEQHAGETDTRWVNIGAGSVSLVFFAPRVKSDES